MPIFGKKDKFGNPSINLMSFEGLSGYPKMLAVNLTLLEDTLYIKPRIGKTPLPVNLNLNEIIAADCLTETEIIEKSKNVLGRAVVGGLLLGGVGSIIGGMSGLGKKQKTKSKSYLVLNLKTNENEDVTIISFEVVGATLGLDEFITALKAKANI